MKVNQCKYSIRAIHFIIRYIPHVALIASILTYILLVLFVQRSDLLFKVSIILVPLILSSVIIILCQHKISYINLLQDNITINLNISLRSLRKIYLILLCFSITWFLYSQKQDIFLIILISTTFLVIILQIFSKQRGRSSTILMQLCITTLLLIWSMFAAYPLYYGTTDVLVNVNWMGLVQEIGGRLPPELIEEYYAFPLLSIAGVMINIITDLGLYASAELYCSLPLILALIFMYYLTKTLTHSTTCGLIASLLYVCIPSITKYSSEVMACTLAAFVFILFLYLLFRSNSKISTNKKLILTIILIIYFTLVHHISVPLVFALTVILILCYYLCGVHIPKDHKLEYAVLFSIPICYWAYTFLSNIISIFETSLFSGLDTTANDVAFSFGTSQSAFDIGYLVTNFTSGIVVFLTILAVTQILRNKKYNFLSVFALITLILLVLFVPGIIDVSVLLSDYLRIVRWRLLMVPFFVVIISVGCIILTNILSLKVGKRIATIFLITLLLITCVLSPVIYYTSNSDVFTDEKINNYKYFTENELNIYNFISGSIENDETIVADWHSKRYFYDTVISSKYNHTSYNTPYDITIYALFTSETIPDIYQYTYILFCEDKYYNRQYTGYLPGAASPVLIKPNENHSSLFFKNIYQHNSIFSNGACSMYTISN